MDDSRTLVVCTCTGDSDEYWFLRMNEQIKKLLTDSGFKVYKSGKIIAADNGQRGDATQSAQRLVENIFAICLNCAEPIEYENDDWDLALKEVQQAIKHSFGEVHE